MKVRNPESELIENVTFFKEGEHINARIGDMEVCAHMFILMNYEIVDMAREDFKVYHEFLDDARFFISETAEYFEGKVDAWNEIHDSHEKEEKEDVDKDKNKKKKKDRDDNPKA